MATVKSKDTRLRFLVHPTAGKDVTEKDLIAAYRAQHGTHPDVDHQARPGT